MEAAKFVVSDAAAALWESALRHDGFPAFTRRAPEQLIRWEAEYGWTRSGYGQVPEKETALGVLLSRLLTTPDMWRTFAEAYVTALDAAGRAPPSGHDSYTRASISTSPGTSARSAPKTSRPGMGCLSFPAEIGAQLPPLARELLSERSRFPM